MIRRSPRNPPPVTEYPITVAADQQLISTPSMSAAVNNNAAVNNVVHNSISQVDFNGPSTSEAGESQIQRTYNVPSSVSETGTQVDPHGSIASNTSQSQAPMIFSNAQFRELMSGLSMRQETRSTFSNCTARFSGGRNSTKVEDFLVTILVYKEAEGISDLYALTSLPLLLDGYASSWWQGVQDEARTFTDAVYLLRNAFAPVKPDWRIFSEICQERQKTFETTDEFICRKRRLFANYQKS